MPEWHGEWIRVDLHQISQGESMWTYMYTQKYRNMCTVFDHARRYTGCGVVKAISCETVLTTQYGLPARGLANPLAGNPLFSNRSDRILSVSCSSVYINREADSPTRPSSEEAARSSKVGRDCESMDRSQSLENFVSTPLREFAKITRIQGGEIWLCDVG